MKSEVLAWVPRRQELVHHTPQDQSSTPGHPGAVVTSTSTSYFKLTRKAEQHFRVSGTRYHFRL